MIAGLKPYPEYRAAEGRWLGEIPSHWAVRRMKYVVREIDSRSRAGQEQLLRVSQYTGVTQRRRSDGGEEPDTRAESLVGYKRVEPRDLVVNIMLAWNGSMGVSPYAGIASPAYCVYRFQPSLHPWYFHELLRSPMYKARIKASSTGVVESRLRLYSDDLNRIEALVPPLGEQTAIVRFLDWANGRLELAIRAKRKVIALLTEQQRVIVHCAVTQGLDATVSRQATDIGGLDFIPTHWETRRLKSLVKESVAGPYGSSLTKSMYAPSGYRVYGQQQVIPDDFSVGDYYIAEKLYVELQHYRVWPDDVLVSVMGTIGKVAVVPEGAAAGIINPRLVRYRPNAGAVRPRWLQLAMQDRTAQTQLRLDSKGTTMDGLNMQTLGKLRLLVPPLTEQDEILRKVSEVRAPFAKAMSRLELEIDLLREYRTRLIADVVSGKLDVREAAATLPEDATGGIGAETADETDDPELIDEEATEA